MNAKSAHAIVIGGSMSGLLAARALCEHFDQVTLIERDAFVNDASRRKGVPQGVHIHGLLASGKAILESFFPGLSEALRSDGAIVSDACRDMAWNHAGSWRSQMESDIDGMVVSRPMLEWHVRKRLLAMGKVRCLDGRKVINLVMNDERTRVTGVRFAQDDQSDSETLHADLVVDASGRGSRLPTWLTEIGLSAPEERHVKVGVGYVSRMFERTRFSARGKVLFVTPNAPTQTRMGALFPIEDDRFLCSLVGWHGDHAPLDDDGFLAYAQSLPVPDVFDMIVDAKPLSPIVMHKIPSSQRRLYEALDNFPDGLLVVGDAVCSFNPTYGQGMTIAAMQARALADATLDTMMRRGFSRRFQRHVAKILSVPWLLATSEDFRYPSTEGDRPFGLSLMHAYVSRLQALAGRDEAVQLAFYRVMHLLAPPTTLFAPWIAMRVLGTKSAASR